MSTTEFWKKKVQLLGWLSFLFIISLLSWKVFGNTGKRYILFFKSSDTTSVMQESRYIRPINGKNMVVAYVDELLLGPQMERCRPLFAAGTKVLSCFEHDGTLYVNFNDAILKDSSEAVTIMEGTKLFQDNIRKNFVNIKVVEMFVEGIKMYEVN